MSSPVGSLRRRRAASALTYGLLVGLLGVVAITAITRSGGAVNQLFGTVAARISGVGSIGAGGPRANPLEIWLNPAFNARTFGDGTLASTCQGYRQPGGSYRFAGADAVSGLYRLSLGGGMTVHCDMVTDGGGWTRFWWYTRSSWPMAETDTLAYQLSAVDPNADYGFARIPSNVTPATLLVQSASAWAVWTFDSNVAESNRALGAFRNGSTQTRSAGQGAQIWNATRGSMSPAYTCHSSNCRNFWYDTVTKTSANPGPATIRSFNLDDDSHWGATAFGAGYDGSDGSAAGNNGMVAGVDVFDPRSDASSNRTSGTYLVLSFR